MFNERFKSHHDAERGYKHLLKQKMSNEKDLIDYLNTTVCTKKDNTIYIHIPFCDKICSFCNLNRQVKDKTLEEYVNNIIIQIKNLSKTKYIKSANIGAIYFGGGTPTTLNHSQIENIIIAIKENFCLEDNVEITIETTLHNLTNEHINIFKKYNINRLSIGIQTFQDEGRKFFNRTYTKQKTIEKLKNIRETFNGCLSIDKIYNYPNETLEMLSNDIENIIDLNIDSVSFYSLMIHNGSALSKNTNIKYTNENDELFHNYFIDELRKSSNFEFLELTKLARKNKDKYNYIKIRNSNGNTIPLGKGAGGQIDNYSIYIMNFEKTMVSYQESNLFESANKLYGIFQNTIIDKKEIICYNLESYLESLLNEGYLLENDNQFILTNKGIFYGNNIGAFIVRNYLEKETSL